ncbi:FAD-dependent monooxygenase [Actinoplanes couchii]|uniref:FAD-dependent oxidoreductase n=1 Tax=Actinoplanes couchii TaxID=403638 RepID=A0ABQ3XEI3_9ACTN|nr:FAD-dependent monooxygenase [Actinoplanes couchii]MDR6319753.1 2-polyprenyl-6-methoxyphenol hydroxylase-like FAD-dependent oxidoreductase [Actinoplanes couchii]GID56887.1 FAD-dependent oxidoreductase [Actinoplanes couchii]
MINKRVLISGASIGGPALAYWLHRHGFDVTVVEKAGEIRRGGQAVDFKGPIHRRVLSEMGILDRVKQATVMGGDDRIVDARGRTIGFVPAAFAGGEFNIPRGDLARLLYALTAHTCEYVFGDSITSLTETASGVDVTFTHGAPRTFDLVVGADGMHSNVRRLAFGPESDHVTHLGYYYALADLDAGDDNVAYNEPGRMVGLGGSKAPAFFVFAADRLPARDDVDAQKQMMMDAYRDGRWRIPELLTKIPAATGFYMDSISRATVDRYSTGRVALVGDSAWGNALGGFGTGLAMVGAYVLAGELARAGGDHTVAFPQFETKFREYASISDKINAGRLLAPRTRPGIVARNLLFTALKLFSPAMRLIEGPAKNITLDDYASTQPA